MPNSMPDVFPHTSWPEGQLLALSRMVLYRRQGGRPSRRPELGRRLGGGFASIHLMRRSYSSWVPIQNQVTVSALSNPTALYAKPMRTE